MEAFSASGPFGLANPSECDSDIDFLSVLDMEENGEGIPVGLSGCQLFFLFRTRSQGGRTVFSHAMT